MKTQCKSVFFILLAAIACSSARAQPISSNPSTPPPPERSAPAVTTTAILSNEPAAVPTTPLRDEPASRSTASCKASEPVPDIHHVFLIVLENMNYDVSLGDRAPASRLKEIAHSNKRLEYYYGIGHNSLDNYIALISGQPPNPATQMDCPVFEDFKEISSVQHNWHCSRWNKYLRSKEAELLRGFTTSTSDRSLSHGAQLESLRTDLGKIAGIAKGECDGEHAADSYKLASGWGCVYPPSVTALADQFDQNVPPVKWRAYMESMPHANKDKRPDPGRFDKTYSRENLGYATRHNPFAYFHSLTDLKAGEVMSTFDTNDRPLDNLEQIENDLMSEKTEFPQFVFISPNLCHDGHTKCLGITKLQAIDRFVPDLVGAIQKSDAYRDDGVIIITFDEAEVPKGFAFLPSSDDEGDGNESKFAKACCDERSGPMWKKPGLRGPGGGQVGAIIISNFVKPGVYSDHEFNHYSLLRSIEDMLLTRVRSKERYLGFASQPSLRTLQECGVFDNPTGHSESITSSGL